MDATSNVGLTISLDFLKRPGLQSPSPAPRSPRDGDTALAGEGLLTLIRRAASSLILRTLGDEDGAAAAAVAAEASCCSVGPNKLRLLLMQRLFRQITQEGRLLLLLGEMKLSRQRYVIFDSLRSSLTVED